MSNQIKIKRGNKSTLPTLSEGEFGYALDTNELYIGGLVDVEVENPDAKVKLNDPSTLPAGTVLGTALSPDGNYLAVAHGNSPFVTIYKRNGDAFDKLPDPDVLPTGTGNGCAFSPDGVYLSVAHSGSPYITIYKRNGDSFTKVANPSTLPSTNSATGVSFSSNASHLSVSANRSPFITVYERSNDTFTKIQNPNVLPPELATSTSISSDGIYVAVGHLNSPYVSIYKRDGQTLTKLANPSFLPTRTAYGVSFSPDGVYLAVGWDDPNYLTIYKRSGDTFTKLSDPNTLPSSTVNGVSFSPDGNYLSVAVQSTTKNLIVYKRDGDTFTEIDSIDTLQSSSGRSTSLSNNSSYAVVGTGASPYVNIYKSATSIEQQPGNVLINEGDTEPTGFDVFTDTSGSPGSATPINDLDGNIMADLDKGIAYYGTVSHTDLFTSTEISNAVGITAGVVMNEQEVWYKYYWNGGIHFWRRPVRNTLSWNDLWLKGVVYGTGTSTSRKGYNPIEFDGQDYKYIRQATEVEKNGVKYAVRLLEGSTYEPTMSPATTVGQQGMISSEVNLILMNLHAATNSGQYSDSPTDGVTYNNWTKPNSYSNDDFVGWKTNLGDSDFLLNGDGDAYAMQEVAYAGGDLNERLYRLRGIMTNNTDFHAGDNFSAVGWAPVLTVKHSSFTYE